jgi:hypothetical protein
VLVSSLSCTGDAAGQQSLWQGARPALLPAPTKGFNAWQYLNTNTAGLGGSAVGGRCIFTTPSIANASGNPGIVQGLSKAATRFSSGTTFDSTNEVIYDPGSASQKFIVWITIPTGTPDSNCLP